MQELVRLLAAGWTARFSDATVMKSWFCCELLDCYRTFLRTATCRGRLDESSDMQYVLTLKKVQSTCLAAVSADRCAPVCMSMLYRHA